MGTQLLKLLFSYKLVQIYFIRISFSNLSTYESFKKFLIPHAVLIALYLSNV